MRERFAKAASSRNLSTRPVASSTVEPMTLISSPAGFSEGFDVTVTLRRDGGRGGGSGRRGFDAGDLIDGDFHAQRAGFDFGGVAVDAAQDDGFAETANADFGAGLETGCARCVCCCGGDAEIGLRIGESLHEGGVEFFAGFAASVLQFAA